MPHNSWFYQYFWSGHCSAWRIHVHSKYHLASVTDTACLWHIHTIIICLMFNGKWAKICDISNGIYVRTKYTDCVYLLCFCLITFHGFQENRYKSMSKGICTGLTFNWHRGPDIWIVHCELTSFGWTNEEHDEDYNPCLIVVYNRTPLPR